MRIRKQYPAFALGAAMLLAAAGSCSAGMGGPGGHGMGGGFGPGPGGGGGYGPGPGGGGGGISTTYDTQFTTLHFSGSGNCSMCHNGLLDENGDDVSIETDWSSTAMAHASRDPLWRAKVSSELARNPALAPVINEKCSRCHAPMANTEAVYHDQEIDLLGGMLTPADAYYDAAMDGVSCTLCHQIADSLDLGTEAAFSGHYTIDTYANPLDRRIYGPYDNVFAMPMLNMVSYTIAYSPHIKRSAVCATCHNLRTPYVDEAGNVISTPETEFPEQMTYSEWLASDYANLQSCQDCHMPRTNGVIMATRPMWLSTLRDDFATHTLIGGNNLLLDLLQNNAAELGATDANIPTAIQQTEQMLRSAVSLELTGGSLVNNELAFDLQVTNLTGHKLPTGIPLRRMVLHVKVVDPRGRVVFESGRINTDGSVTGLDSDVNPATYEPHYGVITSPNQVQAYEAIMGDSRGQVTCTLLSAADMLKDNRLLPTGMDKASASPDIKVAGAASLDADFDNGGDTISFRLAGMKSARYTVTAELVYQPLSFAFLADMDGDATPETTALAGMYQASTAKSTSMTAATFQIRR
ncbi:MAG: multiheme c-type cytochrome [Thermodesulfobacteriota bacterium]